ncbi:hypothetical protein [Limnohabitans sp.]|uniref:hypothetical protein n=1 Tax=Limnohabitans sp. TaxID=1907725 RepID=UPI00286ECD32|nr:hypothetical protein [Limnohabitans sp.]
MQTEKCFDQAVTLAAAFVANGDIRLNGNTGVDAQSQAMLKDLLTTLYQTLVAARQDISRDVED